MPICDNCGKIIPETCPDCGVEWRDGIAGCPVCGWGNPMKGIECLTPLAGRLSAQDKDG